MIGGMVETRLAMGFTGHLAAGFGCFKWLSDIFPVMISLVRTLELGLAQEHPFLLVGLTPCVEYVAHLGVITDKPGNEVISDWCSESKRKAQWQKQAPTNAKGCMLYAY
ncbi:hypothetical protein NC651_033550 [Populus alba x Populus x berolinensis]|nr:hypothetical protein NC651_033550 [Populus alba x Populus x berolinensis]